MTRLLATFVLFLCLSAQALAGPIYIPRQHRVPNPHPGCCGPATLETVGRYQGYRQVYGVTASLQRQPYRGSYAVPGCPPARNHPCFMWGEGLTQILDSRGVPYRYQPAGVYNNTMIRQGTASGRPVIVSVGPETRCGQGHFYAVVGYGNTAYLYDSNHTNKPYVTMPRSQFWRVWRGDSLLIGK